MSLVKLLRLTTHGPVRGRICLQQQRMHRNLVALSSKHVVPASCVPVFRNSLLIIQRAKKKRKNRYDSFAKHDEEKIGKAGKMFYAIIILANGLIDVRSLVSVFYFW